VADRSIVSAFVHPAGLSPAGAHSAFGYPRDCLPGARRLEPASSRFPSPGRIDLVAGIISRAQEDGDLPAQLDATGLAAVLVAATDGLKDLSDILDPPNRSRRGFEQRMQHLTDILEALISQHEDSSHS
jgi:hypothetical protein